MRRFFHQNIQKPAVCIRGEEARHMLKVLRMAEGGRFILFDGSGMDYPCVIESVHADHLFARVGEGVLSEKGPDVRITLYQAMLKRDNMDFVLQKATELGITGFVPVIAARCVKRPDDPQKVRAKFEKTATEAAKQCGRSKIPQIGEITDLKKLPDLIRKHGIVLLAYENGDITIKKRLQDDSSADVGIVIGPEGGFEEGEVKLLCEAGALACSLGKLILRAETAAVAAVSMVLYDKMEIK